MWNYKCDHCGCALDPGEACDCRREAPPTVQLGREAPAEGQRSLNGKPVWTEDNFDYSTVKVGDYVEQAVVDNAMNCLPPACMTSECAQLGEPYSHREDPKTGRWRPTFATFKRVTSGPDGIWQYCGHCFQGENVERGKDPVYC